MLGHLFIKWSIYTILAQLRLSRVFIPSQLVTFVCNKSRGCENQMKFCRSRFCYNLCVLVHKARLGWIICLSAREIVSFCAIQQFRVVDEQLRSENPNGRKYHRYSTCNSQSSSWREIVQAQNLHAFSTTVHAIKMKDPGGFYEFLILCVRSSWREIVQTQNLHPFSTTVHLS